LEVFDVTWLIISMHHYLLGFESLAGMFHQPVTQRQDVLKLIWRKIDKVLK
jgi:hypothetical protein